MKRLSLAITQAFVLFCLCLFLAFEHLPREFLSESISTVQNIVSTEHDLPPPQYTSSLESALGRSSTRTSTISPSTTTNQDTGEYSTSTQTPKTSSGLDSTLTVVDENGLTEIPTITPVPTKSAEEGNNELFKNTSVYIQAILSPENVEFPRLSCPVPKDGRYNYLKSSLTTETTQPRYFFALDLYQAAPLLPRLLGSIVETIRFLGPERCVLSIVEGRSTDGTSEILENLSQDIKTIGSQYFFTRNDINPKAGPHVDRIKALADLRNQALAPLLANPEQFDPDTTVLFVNDVALCMEDILELIHQRLVQQADMTCAMDWLDGGASFYDVWVSRGMNGDQFFEIPQSGTWEYSGNLFWNDGETRNRLDHGQPFQAFACWNGATAFTAKPLIQQKIKFRSARSDECYLGEPTIFCKDMWQLGYGKIAVIPSVNVGYDDEESRKIKERYGSVSTWVEKENSMENLITWKEEPPKQIKCVPSYQHPSWVAWNQ